MRLTKTEIINKIESALVNPQDKLIVYSAYCGVLQLGVAKEGLESLCDLKVEDVDFEKMTITLAGRTMNMDETLSKYAKESIQSDVYYRTANAGIGGNAIILNMSSPYIIKNTPKRTNNNGLDPMKRAGIKTRAKNVLEQIGFDTLLELKKAGAMECAISSPTIFNSVAQLDAHLRKYNYTIAERDLYKFIKEYKNLVK